MNFEKLTAYLDSLEEAYGVPGVDCKVMQEHQVIYRHRCGHRDYAKQHRVDGTELYDIYSASKVITMVAVMQLVEQGKLRLTDDVTRYIPAFAGAMVADHYEFGQWPPVLPKAGDPCHPAKNPILIKNLMSMTAGLSYDIQNPILQEIAQRTGGSANTLTMVNGIARLPLLYEPGTRYVYSLGHDVLAAVVEIVSGEKFRDYLENHIFRPLEITDMYLHPGAAEQGRMADQWIVTYPEEKVEPSPTGNQYRLTREYDSGGAGITCSVDAYSRIIDALACGGVGWNGARILTPDSIRQLAEPQLSEIQLQDFGRGHMGYSYGLGVRTLIHKQIARSPIGEFGWDGAAGAFCLVDPVNRISIYYAQEILNMVRSYFEIHPTLRDLVYEGMDIE